MYLLYEQGNIQQYISKDTVLYSFSKPKCDLAKKMAFMKKVLPPILRRSQSESGNSINQMPTPTAATVQTGATALSDFSFTRHNPLALSVAVR